MAAGVFMMNDPIVEEVHRIREEMLAEFGGDLGALLHEMQQRTEEARKAGKLVIESSPRPPLDSAGANKKAGY
jgi:hypothetical protein